MKEGFIKYALFVLTTIEQRSKHFLLIYKGSKTPSDVRSTNNLISIICNTIPKEELI